MAECRITLIMPHSSPQNLIISVDRCLVFMVFMDGKDNVFMTAVRFVLTKLLTFLLYVYPLLLLCNYWLFDVIFFLLAVLLSKNEVGDSILFFPYAIERVSQVYELDGTEHDSRWVLQAYINVTQQFVHDHPDFTGVKFIFSTNR